MSAPKPSGTTARPQRPLAAGDHTLMVESTGHSCAPIARMDPSRLLAMVVTTIGGMVLTGWVLDIDLLKRLVPGLVTMKPNAALAFVLAGWSLWALQGGARARRTSIGLAAGVAAIGGLTLFEYASGIGLGIDEVTARAAQGRVLPLPLACIRRPPSTSRSSPCR